MPRYIALLRGINVGGNTMIKMAELKVIFESLGFENVATYINSGNVAFDARKAEQSELARAIGEAIERDFDKKVAIMIRSQDELRYIVRRNPFAGQFTSHKEMHVLFMNEPMPDEKFRLLLEKQTNEEQFAADGREVFCLLRLGVADSLLGKGFIERKLKVSITARNWRTVEALTSL